MSIPFIRKKEEAARPGPRQPGLLRVVDAPEILPLLAPIEIIETRSRIVSHQPVGNLHQPRRLIIRHLDVGIGRQLTVLHLRGDALFRQDIVDKELGRVRAFGLGGHQAELDIGPAGPGIEVGAEAELVALVSIVAKFG